MTRHTLFPNSFSRATPARCSRANAPSAGPFLRNARSRCQDSTFSRKTRLIRLASLSRSGCQPWHRFHWRSSSGLWQSCHPSPTLLSELRPFGISVLIIEPGAMQTEIFQKSAARAQQVRQQLPGELLQLYAPTLAAVAKASAHQHLESPDVVGAAVVHALTSRRPRTRYLAGRGSGMIVFLRLLPDHVRDRLLLRALGLAHIQPVSEVKETRSNRSSYPENPLARKENTR